MTWGPVTSLNSLTTIGSDSRKYFMAWVCPFVDENKLRKKILLMGAFLDQTSPNFEAVNPKCSVLTPNWAAVLTSCIIIIISFFFFQFQVTFPVR